MDSNMALKFVKLWKRAIGEDGRNFSEVVEDMHSIAAILDDDFR